MSAEYLDVMRQVNLSDMDKEYKKHREFMTRCRFFVGLRDAFEEIPELKYIRCCFGVGNGPPGGFRTLKKDIRAHITQDCEVTVKPGEYEYIAQERAASKLQNTLDKVLQKMRQDLSANDAYGAIAVFFNHNTVVLYRDNFFTVFDMLVSKEIEKLNPEVMAKLEEHVLSQNTMEAKSKKVGPRL